MVATNANSGRLAINYFRLFTKLKVELSETIPKKLHNAKKSIPPKHNDDFWTSTATKIS